MSEPPQKTPAASPRRFFRKLNLSPFRLGALPQKQGADSATSREICALPVDFEHDGSPSFKFHGRSHSHEISGSAVQYMGNPGVGPGNSGQPMLVRRRKPTAQEWTQLIPPLPTLSPSSSLRSGSPLSGGTHELHIHDSKMAVSAPPDRFPMTLNRHTIAGAPAGVVLIPDMLQPLQDGFREQLFVINRQPHLRTNSDQSVRQNGLSTAGGQQYHQFLQLSGILGPLNTPQRPLAKPPARPVFDNSLNSSFLLAEKPAYYAKPPVGASPHEKTTPFWADNRAQKGEPKGQNHTGILHARGSSVGNTASPAPNVSQNVPRNMAQNQAQSTHRNSNLPQNGPRSMPQNGPRSMPQNAPPPLLPQALLHAVPVVLRSDLVFSFGPSQMNLPQEGQGQGQGPNGLHKNSESSLLKTHRDPQDTGPPPPRRASTGKKRKTCTMCGHAINGQFVRALNGAYHVECFKCYDCGALCLAKFFPHEVPVPGSGPGSESAKPMMQVPLCEYDYFKKLSLICFTCDSALRGPYITALGNKYHLEHFKCSACGKVFESDESYYEHNNSVYCHFHYSKLFATKCEGCHSSIVKQFIELFKSGKVQQWHPECYMVSKFWNVSVTIDCVGLPDSAVNVLPDEMSAADMVNLEQKVEATVAKCWVVLSGFEEIAASCILEMLVSACAGKRLAGLLTTGKLMLFIEVLFGALDYVQNMCAEFKPDTVSMTESKKALMDEVYSIDAFDKFQALRKEPRNISGKLMSYLAILRKSHHIAKSGSLSSDLLAVITGCAHYLKLLIRIGLTNALALNRLRGDTKGLDGFLGLVKGYDEIEAADKVAGDSRKSIGMRLSVPLNSTDACRACSKSIEKSCILYADSRWHHKCFECSKCHRKPSTEYKVESFLRGANDNILCTDCAMSDKDSGVGYTSGFVRVSDLSQLMYLLKIALSRSRSAIKKDSASGSMDYLKPASAMSHIAEEPSETDTAHSYSKTLDEVTSLRQLRENQTLGSSVKKSARKSVILEAPEAASARADNTSNYTDDRRIVDRKDSASSGSSFTVLRRDSDMFDFHTKPVKIRDDPPLGVPSSLNRTSDLLKNEKSLTLDDIPRIVAAEQARDQRPNAFKHHNSLYQKKSQRIKSVSNNPLPLESPQANLDGSNKPESKPKFFSELSEHESTVLQHIAMEAISSMGLAFSREDIHGFITAKKQTNFWDKFRFGSANSGDKGKAANVFGVDLTEVAKKYGVDSSLGVGPSQLRIPMLIEDIILALRQKDMSVEGIFRLNGNIKNLRELTEQINAAPLQSPNYSNYSAVQLAALMKKWLRELPNPLLTFNLYEMWISSRREQNPVRAKRILHLASCLLPTSHRNLLEVLLYFFSWVASFAEIDEESGSKMDIHNLATVLAPNILLSKAAAGENGENQSSDAHFLAIEVVNQLIEIHEDLAVIPSDLWEFYEKCQFTFTPKTESISVKDVQGKISKVAKENPGFFVASTSGDSSLEPSHHDTIKSGQTKVHDMEKREQ